MKRELRLIKSTAILFLGTFIPKIIQFILLPILTTCLTTSEYGTYELISTLFSFFIPIFTLQIQVATFRYLLDDTFEKNEVITVSVLFVFFTSLIGAFFCLIFFGKHGITLAVVISIYYFFQSLLSLNKDILRGIQKIKSYAIISIIESILSLLVIVCSVIYFQNKLFSLYVGLSFATCLVLLFSIWQSNLFQYIRTGIVDNLVFTELLRYSIPMIPNGLSHWIISASDRLIITLFMGISYTGLYSAAAKIPSILNLFQTTFINAWQENTSIYINDRDSNEYFSAIFKNIFNLLISIAICILSVIQPLFGMLFSKSYSIVKLHSIILIIGAVFNILSSVIGGLYIADKKTREIGYSTIIAALINICINIICIKQIGLYAASFSTLISYIILFVYRIIDVKKYVNIYFDYVHLLKNCCILILIAILSAINIRYFWCVLLILSIILSWLLNIKLIKKTIQNFNF